METIKINLDSTTKRAADSLFESLGLDTLTAIKMFISASLDVRGIPFDIKKRSGPIEIHDGFGSYICEYGHLHNYSQFKIEDYGKELEDTKTYTDLNEMWADLDSEDDNDEV